MSDEFYWIAVAVVTVMSAARLTRLMTWDEFPPTKWLREKYADRTDGSDWQLLVYCGYCASFWITALVVGTGILCDVYGPGTEVVGNDWPWFMIWWIVNGTLGGSYLAAIVMANDGDDGEDD